MVDRYERLDQKPYGSVYLYVETIIDHPVEKVWPHALDIGGWMSAHRLETIAGEPGKVGHFERVHPHGLGADVPKPHYHLYGIAKTIPHQLIVLEVFPEKGGSYGIPNRYISFDNIFLIDLGGRTKVLFLMIDAHVGDRDEQYEIRRSKEVEGAVDMLSGYFENLRRLVDNGR